MTDRSRNARLDFVALEDRAVPASLGSIFDAVPLARSSQPAAAADIYTETNNPAPGRNAVLGFHRDAGGSLTQFGTFATGGTGQLNQPKAVGPDDGDQQVVATPDGKFLFAVNQGSDSVSAFRIRNNGRLDLVGTFDSKGDQPVSVGIVGDRVYVADRGDVSSANQAGTTAPRVTGFDIGSDGSLTPVANSTVDFPLGTFVTQTLPSRDGRFLFVETGTFNGTAGGNAVTTFRVNGDGSLTAAPGGPASAGAKAPLLLGAATNPRYNIVYAGFASSSQVGVFTYDETGRTSYVGPSADAGAAPCWCVVSPDGRLLYVANTVSDSVGVFSLADPLKPVQIQEFALGGPRGVDAKGGSISQAFEIALDPSGKYLYVVGQTTDPSFPQGNQLHTLSVARDGTLTEKTRPVELSRAGVPANAHPQGLAVVAVNAPKAKVNAPRGGQVGARFAEYEFADAARS